MVDTYLLAEAGVPTLEIANLEELAQDRVLEFVFLRRLHPPAGAPGAPIRPIAMALRH